MSESGMSHRDHQDVLMIAIVTMTFVAGIFVVVQMLVS
jgi:hypothetical protein